MIHKDIHETNDKYMQHFGGMISKRVAHGNRTWSDRLARKGIAGLEMLRM
jgi:hypothetical protein